MNAVNRIDTPDLLLEWTESTWDTAVFGFPVLQITHIEVRGPASGIGLRYFREACDSIGCGLVSCRLPHECLRESMLLEEHGFRFIEMLYKPELDNIQSRFIPGENGLVAAHAVKEEIPAVLEIAESAFVNERFQLDHRLDPAMGDKRYCNWVISAIDHPTQELYVLRNGRQVVAFFIAEMMPDKTCYWHLNAVEPVSQGQGYGKRAWITMLRLAREQGAEKVQTCIVARNYRVLNLYARLGFSFPPPLMTFHWVGSSST